MEDASGWFGKKWGILMLLCLLGAMGAENSSFKTENIHAEVSEFKLHVWKNSSFALTEYGIRVALTFLNPVFITSRSSGRVPLNQASVFDVLKAAKIQLDLNNITLFSDEAPPFGFIDTSKQKNEERMKISDEAVYLWQLMDEYEFPSFGPRSAVIALRTLHKSSKADLENLVIKFFPCPPIQVPMPCIDFESSTPISLRQGAIIETSLRHPRVSSHHAFLKRQPPAVFLTPERARELQILTDEAIRTGWHASGMDMAAMHGIIDETGTIDTKKKAEEAREEVLELLETGVASRVGVTAGVLMRARTTLRNPLIVEGAAPLVEEQIRERMLVKLAIVTDPMVSDALGGAPANTAGGAGFGESSVGARMQQAQQNKEEPKAAEKPTVKGPSKGAPFPGMIGAAIASLVGARISMWIDKTYIPFSKIVSGSLNRTMPFQMRWPLVKSITYAANNALSDIVSRGVHRTVAPALLERLSIFLTRELNRTVTTWVTRSVTQALSQATQEAYHSTAGAHCQRCHRKGYYDEHRHHCASCSRWTKRAERLHYYAAWYADYYVQPYLLVYREAGLWKVYPDTNVKDFNYPLRPSYIV